MPCLTKYTAAICPECEGPIVDDPLSGEGLCECPHQPRWICPINGEQWEPSGHLPEAAELAAWIDDNTVGWDVVRGRRNRWAVVPVGAKFGLVTDCDREAKVTWFDADADARQAMASGSDR